MTVLNVVKLIVADCLPIIIAADRRTLTFRAVSWEKVCGENVAGYIPVVCVFTKILQRIIIDYFKYIIAFN